MFITVSGQETFVPQPGIEPRLLLTLVLQDDKFGRSTQNRTAAKSFGDSRSTTKL